MVSKTDAGRDHGDDVLEVLGRLADDALDEPVPAEAAPGLVLFVVTGPWRVAPLHAQDLGGLGAGQGGLLAVVEELDQSRLSRHVPCLLNHPLSEEHAGDQLVRRVLQAQLLALVPRRRPPLGRVGPVMFGLASKKKTTYFFSTSSRLARLARRRFLSTYVSSLSLRRLRTGFFTSSLSRCAARTRPISKVSTPRATFSRHAPLSRDLNLVPFQSVHRKSSTFTETTER